MPSKPTQKPDFSYIFFGRHEKSKTKYLAAFVLVLIIISVAAFYLQSSQSKQIQKEVPVSRPQALQESGFFTPGPDKTQYGPKLVYYDNNPAWEYSLPEGTIVTAADNGILHPMVFGPKTFIIKSMDGKWLLVHSSKNVAGVHINLKPNSNIGKGEKLFSVHADSGNFVFSVIKRDRECTESPDKVCPYVNPQEYFDSLKSSS